MKPNDYKIKLIFSLITVFSFQMTDLALASEQLPTDCELILAMTRVEFRDPSTVAAQFSRWRKKQIEQLLEIQRNSHGLPTESYYFQVANLIPARYFKPVILWIESQIEVLRSKKAQLKIHLPANEAESISAFVPIEKLEPMSRVLRRKLDSDSLLNASEILSMSLYLRKVNRNLATLMQTSLAPMTGLQRQSLIESLGEDVPWDEMDRSLTGKPFSPYSQTHETYVLLQRGLLAVPWVSSMLSSNENLQEVMRALLGLGVVVVSVDQDTDIVPNLYSGRIPFRLEETMQVRFFGAQSN